MATAPLAPVGVSGDTPADGQATAAANTSLGREVEFWFSEQGGILELRTSNLDTPDPYGGDPIRHSPEVVCSDKDLVLLRLRSTHRNFPTDYFVYGGQRGAPWVARIPEVVPDLVDRRSVGLLRAVEGDRYVVANLRQAGQEGAFLDLFYSSSSDSNGWIQAPVALPLPKGKEGWETHQVVPFKGSLIWVDLNRGILLCPNLFRDEDPNLEYIPLPPDLPQLPPAHPLNRSRSIGCSDGELKLVDLLTGQASMATKVAISTLDRDLLQWKEEASMTLDYATLSARMKANCDSLLPPWEELGKNTPCYPVLMGDMLYLTMAGENNRAWLLHIDMQTGTLNGIADYSPFFNYKNPPFPDNLPKFPNSWPRDDPCVTNHPNIQIDGADLQVDDQLVIIGVAS